MVGSRQTVFAPVRCVEGSEEGIRVSCISSRTAEDPEWDAFLEGVTSGQYQQSSRWSRVKAVEGWQVYRELFRSERGLEGGFQLLWKQTRFGRMGYISKGPVLKDERDSLVGYALGRMLLAARELRLTGLIVQPPDMSRIGGDTFKKHGFCNHPLWFVISSTWLIPVADGRDAVLGRMSQTMRNCYRRAVRASVEIVEGSRRDIKLFFDLMVKSCRRQGTTPNPSRVDVLEAVWDAFWPRVRLSFARVEGATVAGLLQIGFGKRLTLWKKGWDETHSREHPNALLYADALFWAARNGYEEYDTVAFDRDMAERFLAGRCLTDDQLRSRHLFHVRLGGRPVLLPEARIYMSNPIARFVFDRFAGFSIGRALLGRVCHIT